MLKAWGWSVLGGLILALSLLMLVAAALFISGSTPATGTVIDREGRGGGTQRLGRGRNSQTMVPVVAYRDDRCRMRRFVGTVALPEARVPTVGSQVPVRYQRLADGTMSARIDSVPEVWALPAFLAVFGAGFTGAGLLARRVVRQPGTRSRPVRPSGAAERAHAAQLLQRLRRRRR